MFVVSPEGVGLGIKRRDEAIEIAREQGLDLILVNQNATPPVAKILDLQKFIFEKKQQRRESLKKSKRKAGELKKIRFKPNIAPNDLRVRIKRAKEFLEEGYKIKFTVQYLGRQITHKEVGEEKLNRVLEELEGLYEMEKEPWFEKKLLMAIIRPK